ncbi:MAG: ABC transporter substrate-binding protein [Oscillospiraceae bacterium]|nr:ABC transporter substrate-binding protein [Oscillospiraceae bacterium]
MKKKFCLLLAAVLTAVAVLAGCGDRGGDTVTVRLNEVTHSVFYAPQYVAIEQGFFAEEGLSIELTNGGGADKVMTAVVSGQSDIGLAGGESCIYVYNQGKADYPRIFAQLTKRDGSFLVGRTDDAFSWDALRGTTVIGGRLGGMPEMTLEYVLRKNGLEPNVDVTVDTSIQFNMMAGAFTGGNGDYVALFEPSATQVVLEGQGYILCSLGAESGDVPYTTYFATQSYLSDHADVVQKFTNAIARAQKWVASHSDQEVAEAIAPQFPDTDTKVVAEVVGRLRSIDAWNATPVMESSAWERLETIMTGAGQLQESERVPFEVLVDNSFAQKVK